MVEKFLTPEAAKNFAAYKIYCAPCHMEDGRGVTGMQPSLRGSAVAAGDVTRLIRVVLKGPAAVLPANRRVLLSLLNKSKQCVNPCHKSRGFMCIN